MNPAAGIGLRGPHLAEIARERPATAFLEIHAENYLSPTPATEAIERLRADYPFSVHAVGLSLGSAAGIDDAHLGRVADLVKRLQPAYVSDHLSWSVTGGRYFNDLLPLPYTEEALAVVVGNVQHLQDRLGRQVSIENPSCYLGFTHSTMSEPEFLSEVAHRSGCGLLGEGEASFLETLAAGRTLEEAAVSALAADAVFDLSPTFARLLHLRVFVAVQ